jgi:hypothetical protein
MMEDVAMLAKNWMRYPLFLLAFAGLPGAPIADSAPPAAAELDEPDSSEERQRMVTIGIYLLIALTVGTVSFLILLMLWGARVRRQARKPLPGTTPNDRLWYLKSKKHLKTEADTKANVSDNNADLGNPWDDSSTD